MSTPAGWYDDGNGRQRYWDGSAWGAYAGADAAPAAPMASRIASAFNDEAGKVNTGTGKYRVLQVVLREKFVGKGSKNFAEIEEVCNQQYAQGYRLHTFAQSTAQSTGFGGGDRTVCNVVFERIAD